MSKTKLDEYIEATRPVRVKRFSFIKGDKLIGITFIREPRFWIGLFIAGILVADLSLSQPIFRLRTRKIAKEFKYFRIRRNPSTSAENTATFRHTAIT